MALPSIWVGETDKALFRCPTFSLGDLSAEQEYDDLTLDAFMSKY